MSKLAKWVTHFKGGPEKTSWEIAVIKEDNTHGIESYGWYGKDKRLISHSGGPCSEKVSFFVWDMLIDVAEAYADYLNRIDE